MAAHPQQNSDSQSYQCSNDVNVFLKISHFFLPSKPLVQLKQCLSGPCIQDAAHNVCTISLEDARINAHLRFGQLLHTGTCPNELASSV